VTWQFLFCCIGLEQPKLGILFRADESARRIGASRREREAAVAAAKKPFFFS